METIRTSFGARILALNPGETAAEARRLRLDGLTGKADVEAAVEKMRNLANPAVKQAKEATDGEYVVETGSILTTKSKDLLIVCAVTRSE